MIKLIAVSSDNLNYEHEGIDFYYGKTLMFKQYGKSLSRGGRGFDLKSIRTNNIVASSGHQNMKGWLKEVVKSLASLGFQISAEEILEAIKTRREQNIKENNAEIESQIQLHQEGINEYRKWIINSEKEIKQLKAKLAK